MVTNYWNDPKNMKNLKIVEGVESVWHYHLSETGKSAQPALCGNKRVMNTLIPLDNWGKKSGHIPDSFCKECDAIFKGRKENG